RTRNQLAADRRLLFDGLCALHALSRNRAIDSRTCMSGGAEHMAVRHAANHNRAFHLFGFRLVCTGCRRAQFFATLACAFLRGASVCCFSAPRLPPPFGGLLLPAPFPLRPPPFFWFFV